MNLRKSLLASMPVLGITGILVLFLYYTYNGTFLPSFVSAVASSLLAIVTTVSVILTLTLLQEQREANRREVKPIVRIDIVPVSINKYNSILENIGNGLAQNLTANLKLHPNGPEWDISERNVRINDKIPAFPPESIDFEDSEYHSLVLSGTVTDMFGHEYPLDDKYEIENVGRTQGPLPYDKDIIDKLDEIKNRLSDIKQALER